MYKYKYSSAVEEKNFARGNEAAPIYTRETFPAYTTSSSSYFFYGDVISLARLENAEYILLEYSLL